MIKTRRLKKYFGEVHAVDDVNFKLNENEITALIGPNGAGKTTFFNLISGEFPPDSGRVFFKGEDITGKPSYKIARKGIAKTFQIASIFSESTVYENIRVSLLSRDRHLNFFSLGDEKKRGDEANSILHEVGLDDVRNIRCDCLPHGYLRLVEIALALGLKPKLLLLDEPVAGLSPSETKIVLKLLKRLSKNVNLFFIEHNIPAAFSIAERVLVLCEGKIIADGRPKEIAKNEKVRKAYFGE